MEPPGVHPDVGQASNVWIGLNLERERGEWCFIVCLARDLFACYWMCSLHGWDIERRRQVIDNCIQEQLDSLVLQCRSAEHWDKLPADRRCTQRTPELLWSRLLSFEVAQQKFLVCFDDLLNQLVSPLARHLDVLCRHLGVLNVLTEVVMVDLGAELDEIDDAVEFRLQANWPLDGSGVRPQPITNHVNGAHIVCADPIQLVDKADAGHMVLVGLPPDCLRLGLHAVNTVKDDDPTISTRSERSTSTVKST